jgi:ferritin-like metal-binding protein YciE
MNTLDELLVDELRDLLDAEKQLVKALPRMAKAASSQELKSAFQEHLEQTKGQVARLEQVFELIGQKARGKPCKAMQGLVAEGQETMQEEGADEILDLALIGAAQRVEHYEMAAYGTARAIAKALGNQEAVQLLQATLQEEELTDKKLTQVAKLIYKQAQQLGQEEEEEEEGE